MTPSWWSLGAWNNGHTTERIVNKGKKFGTILGCLILIVQSFTLLSGQVRDGDGG